MIEKVRTLRWNGTEGTAEFRHHGRLHTAAYRCGAYWIDGRAHPAEPPTTAAEVIGGAVLLHQRDVTAMEIDRARAAWACGRLVIESRNLPDEAALRASLARWAADAEGMTLARVLTAPTLFVPRGGQRVVDDTSRHRTSVRSVGGTPLRVGLYSRGGVSDPPGPEFVLKAARFGDGPTVTETDMGESIAHLVAVAAENAGYGPEVPADDRCEIAGWADRGDDTAAWLLAGLVDET